MRKKKKKSISGDAAKVNGRLNKYAEKQKKDNFFFLKFLFFFVLV